MCLVYSSASGNQLIRFSYATNMSNICTIIYIYIYIYMCVCVCVCVCVRESACVRECVYMCVSKTGEKTCK